MVAFCRYDLLDICVNGPKEKLDSTVISQVSLQLLVRDNFRFMIFFLVCCHLTLAKLNFYVMFPFSMYILV